MQSRVLLLALVRMSDLLPLPLAPVAGKIEMAIAMHRLTDGPNDVKAAGRCVGVPYIT